MRVVRSTGTELEIVDSASGPRALGALLVVVALGFAWLEHSVAAGGLSPATLVVLVVCTVFTAGGVAIVAVARTTRHRFDQVAGRVVVRAKSLFGRFEMELPLADIADVVLESNTSRTPRGARWINYRIAYVLSSGEHVPWTPYYTGTRADKTVCVSAARAFLKRAAVQGAIPDGVLSPEFR